MAITSAEHLITAEEQGFRADRVVQAMCGLTRSQVTGLFHHQCVSIDGLVCNEPGRVVEEGEILQLAYDAHQRYHPKPRPKGPLGFGVIYEDKAIIVVYKPAAILTVPTPRGDHDTLVDRVQKYVHFTKSGSGAHVVHRLDRGVSGILVFGKSEPMAERMRSQFEQRKPDRVYMALVAGVMQSDEGTLESFLATDQFLNRYSTDDAEIGQLAITHYRVVQRLRDTTLIEVRLETGRRNQIRVHFAEVGHPIVGDPRYAPALAERQTWRWRRLALHAASLGLKHPVSEKLLEFNSPLPIEMRKFINSEVAAATLQLKSPAPTPIEQEKGERSFDATADPSLEAKRNRDPMEYGSPMRGKKPKGKKSAKSKRKKH